MGLLLLILLIVLIVAAQPSYGYSRNWGYRPTGVLTLLLIVLLLLILLGPVPFWFTTTPVVVP
jgi:hypothetical protein